ncbi:MAG: hypothetical protein Q8O03_02775 [Nanoarchaeota archaeon]|nr:hypothetical protein [Nanoarchaeota archaeon]
MEKPPLEKIIEKLEKLDIREWDKECSTTLITKTGGLRFYLTKGGFKNILDGDRIYYELIIRKTDKNAGCIKYSYDGNEKTLREKLENLYKKIDSALKESQDTEILGRLNEFASE